jgi:CubicO group peptidase (beta-lactamase class C family)
MCPLRVAVVGAGVIVAACGTRPQPDPAPPPAPSTLEEFRAAAEQIVRETGVPGAGLALVRPTGVEWAGGVGLADRDQGIPITGDTHFRVGSISKTFVAIALVQQYEDDALDLEAPVAEVAPKIAIQNPFRASPVTVLHLLQHTAGFDDMHFDEMYNVLDAPDIPLADVLARNPASRRVRWRPGTRMSYSNPGYGVAGYVLEQVTGRPYETVIRDRIFNPLGMQTSSFTLTDEDLPLLAKGYDSATGAAVPFTQIYLRPAGNLHTSPRELAAFVQMLLNWGEIGDQLVIDPEYLSNMERPRTSLAAQAGLIYGYGSGIASYSLAGYPVLGHGGGIDGFASAYGYSAGRDAGWVVLVNATHAPTAVERLSELALRYLKHDVEPPAKPEHTATPGVLDRHAGYYHPEGSRNELMGALNWMAGGTTLSTDGNALVSRPVFGTAERYVPISDTLFRRERDVTPSRVFATDEDGRAVLLGDGYYGVRRPRWRVEMVRGAVFLSLALLATMPIALVIWLVRLGLRVRHGGTGTPGHDRPGFWPLKLTLCAIPVSALAFFGIAIAPAREWGLLNTWTRLTFIGSWAVPLLALIASVLVASAWRRGAGRWFALYATAVAGAALCLSAYLAAWDLVGLRPWAY